MPERPAASSEGDSIRAPVQQRELTPMLRHYLEVKAEHPDALLFYRMGDFYELFFDDAELAAPILEVTLTARQKGTPSEAPMAGVPHHALDGYLAKALEAGFKVAICDQVEDPAEAKGLVRREVTRVVTPGTVSEIELLDGKRHNLLAAAVWRAEAGALALLDVSTGDLTVRRWREVEEALDDLRRWSPRELVAVAGTLPPEIESWIESAEPCFTGLEPAASPSPARARERLLDQFGVASLSGFGLADDEPAVVAAAQAIDYARQATRADLRHVSSLVVREPDDLLVLDDTTARNLELFESLRGRERRGSLLAVVDRTVTASGGRLLRDWLAHPLRDVEAIELRHDAVEELVERVDLRQRLRRRLQEIGDLERLATRAVLGSLSPREAATLRDSLVRTPEILAAVAGASAGQLVELAQTDPLLELAGELERTLEETPASSLKDGGVIADGVDDELDRCRSLARDGKQHLLALEARERESTGIGNLKVRYNRVFGYYIEVTKAHQSRVPDHYRRKQTLANAERYFTDELKELEDRILEAEGKQLRLEEELFGRLRERVGAEAVSLRELGHALAWIDALTSFAELAASGGWCRPRIGRDGTIRIRDGRHPVVEATRGREFVPNDCDLDGESAQIVLLTGPNMGGKSTYLRQVALTVLLAQAGSFVPARSAEIGVVDRIFTRVGASDDLARGASTFMVEMAETANILRYASRDSLIVLDEVGRGTATFDGLSLAWAIVEHLHERVGAKTLFATHYHELTELRSVLARVVNRTMAVKEWQDRIVFLHRIVDGAADKSYGIHVARLAGLPEPVLVRAQEVLGNLEAEEYDFSGRPRIGRGESAPSDPGPGQLGLFAGADEVVIELLREVDLERMTPLAALNLLATLKERLEGR